jgi:hypothetical protein
MAKSKTLKELGNIDEGIDTTNLWLRINTVATIIGSIGSLAALLISIYLLTK